MTTTEPTTNTSTDATNNTPTPTPDQPEQPEQAGKEAAKYRRQLRETEAERDALKSTVTTLQRTQVESLAAATLPRAEALWASGTTLDTLVDEDGRVNADAVAEAVQRTMQTLGIDARPRPPRHNPGQGGRPTEVPSTAGWSDFLKGGRG